ncbi:ALF repeat-containing protein [Streptomyces sp. NBC_00247]|uniref:hypothetical protein n=1 Tax=Streptomyces sp. NBC_00247 TaxID=2975689 RepID=UPI002E2A72C7|nr:hypothetical protein [Streptomyces sp. NBC_00247]
MNTTFWSRRRVLSAAAAATAVAALPLTTTARAFAATADTGTGPALPSLPDTPRAKAVAAWQVGGKATRAAAAAALVGTDADVEAFVATGLPSAVAEDNRVALFKSLSISGKGTAAEIARVLDAGDTEIEGFLSGGFARVQQEDLSVLTYTLRSLGGKSVQAAADIALTDGSGDALMKFVTDTQFSARLQDEIAEIYKLLNGAGPELSTYASRALDDGGATAIRWFLEIGQNIARARDDEAATIEQLVAVAQRQSKQAELTMGKAKEESDKAVSAAAEAKKAALEAADEAQAAKEDVAKSAAAARKAASAAKGAANAASTAISASYAAQSAARKAAWAAHAATSAAATAAHAASSAYQAAMAASKDASKTKAATDAAVAARNAAAKARTAAKAADAANAASKQAISAGNSAAAAARDAAAAANASAAAASAAGAARSEAAAARAAAVEADAQAARATRAAGQAQTLANSASTAAAAARDAANSAADHAEKAAAAAEEAVKYAGQSLDFANKSTAYANDSQAAADAAVKAVLDAQEVERLAREAELAKIDEYTEQGRAEAVALAALEQEDNAAARNQLTQQQATDSATLDLIAAAQTAFSAGDHPTAVGHGRNAALSLLSSHGTWTRQAAAFALASGEESVLNWIDADRTLAQQQDDRETVLFISQVSTTDVALAAQGALESDDESAPAAFLTAGAVQASRTDQTAQIYRVLAGNPGKAVTQAATEALDDGSAKAVHDFFTEKYAAAQAEDDNVAVFSALDSAGPYTKMAATLALEGPVWMRRNFVLNTHPRMLQLDADSAAHIAAMQALLAHAAKLAQDATTNAAYAQKTAALARNAADDAQDWADAATDSATKANVYKDQADAHADDAEKSAADAQASAEKAKAAALAARGSARRANYSANQATAAADAATASSISAQASASSAAASAVQAGKDAKTAAAAASEAHRIEIAKRKAEAVEAVKRAAAAAAKAKELGLDPADNSDNDGAKKPGTFLGGTKGDWQDAASTLGTMSTYAGYAAALSLLVPPPAGEVLYGVFGGVSLITGVASTVIYGFTNGLDSAEFLTSAFGVAVGVFTTGLPWGKFTGTVGAIDDAFMGLEKGVMSAGVQAQRLGAAVLSPATGAVVEAGKAVGDAVSDTWHDLTPW